MNKRFYLRCLCFAVALCPLGFSACTEDEAESPVTLYYEQVGDIGPGMPYRGAAPTFRGAQPTEFAIEAITLDGAPFVDEQPAFTLLPGGSLLIDGDNLLPLGTYRFTISCLAAGGRFTFPDILTVRMISATPEQITVTPSLLEVLYDEDRVAWPTAQIEAADEAVSFNAYALVQESGKNYFSVSSSGVISVNMKFEGEIPPGIYTPTLRLSTKAGSADYEQAVTIKVNSKPLAVTYERNPGTAEVAAAFESGAPVLKGSTDEVNYAILSVSPSTDQFSIDAATGVISLPEGHTLAVGEIYDISLAVSNKYSNGEAVALRGAYSVEVVPYIAPIEAATFSYPVSTMTEGCLFEVEKASGFVGDVVTFAFGELPAALDGQLTIDKQTGRISAARGNEIPVGEYSVPVVVSNVKGSAETTLKLTVVSNPNMFRKFGYGNNLGLDAESNADQFRWDVSGTSNKAVTIPLADGYNDFGDRKPSFKMEVVHNWAIQNPTNTSENYVDENGDLHLNLRGNRAGQIGYVRVTATIGEGVTAVSRSTLVFVMLRKPADSDKIEYTPFVHRMNPRKGGYSPVAPTYGAGVDPSKVWIRWRQNCFLYEGLDTDRTPYGGKLEAGQTGRTIAKLWMEYAGTGVLNASESAPLSWFDSQGNKASNTDMAKKLGYFDPENGNLLYINPNKWVVDGEAVNGVLTFQASYSLEAKNSDLGGTAKLIGVAVWFDEKF